MATKKIVLETAPVDPRFASTVDQNKHCWTLYNEYLRCSKRIGIKNEKCYQLFRWANSMCPSDLLVSYYEARRDDLWYGYPYDVQPEELKEGDVIIKRKKHDDHGDHH